METKVMDLPMNDKMITLTLSQQTVIEFAHAIRMMVEPLAESNDKLSFEEANCLTHLFYQVRGFLKQVDPAYLASPQHQALASFYSRELDASWDRLKWTTAEAGSDDSF
jgi:hypothetical protein